eukprot:6133635-Prymnesium_polylepis.3
MLAARPTHSRAALRLSLAGPGTAIVLTFLGSHCIVSHRGGLALYCIALYCINLVSHRGGGLGHPLSPRASAGSARARLV